MRQQTSSFHVRTKINPVKIWWMAARPRALIISCVTVGLGNGLAYATTEHLNPVIVFCTLFFSLFIQVGMHYINDALDFKKGVDTSNRIGFPKVTHLGLASPQAMLRGGLICLIVAFLLGIPLIIKGGWPLIFLLCICVANGYLYTGGPLPLSYAGLGDFFAFLFFGLVGTVTTYYLQTGFIDAEALLTGSQVGCLATVMTATNNLRDIHTDAYANKKTMAVRFGITFARLEITILVLLPFLLGLIWFKYGYPFSALLPFLTFPLGLQTLKSIWMTEPSAKYNQFFMSLIVLQVSFSLLLTIGYFIS